MYVNPIDQSQQYQVVAATRETVQQAGRLFEREFLLPTVRFDLSGQAAGMYRVRRRQQEIRYNPYIFGKYFNDNLANTVPHEVAHYLVDELFGARNVRPHGREWQAIMHRLGAEPAVTCQYDLSGIPLRRQRRFEYSCGCTTYAISTVRHNRVQDGKGSYLCRQCRQPLVYTG
ncbi:MAG: SprT-like domain-containing protein [Pseudomonadota bacterium]